MLLNYLGIWDGSTNVPLLTDGIGTTGDTYLVNVDNSAFIADRDLGSGIRSVAAYTYLIYDGTIWNSSLFTGNISNNLQFSVTAIGDLIIPISNNKWFISIAANPIMNETINIGITPSGSEIVFGLLLMAGIYTSINVNLYFETLTTIYITGVIGSITYQFLTT